MAMLACGALLVGSSVYNLLKFLKNGCYSPGAMSQSGSTRATHVMYGCCALLGVAAILVGIPDVI
jgi:hypothetical protein